MRRFARVVLPFLLLCGFSARAQVVIVDDNLFNKRLSRISASVVDSLSGESIVFASVYVIPSKDTIITNFTLTDTLGRATLDEVPFGSYVFHVEMMGYKPFAKERYFRDERVDMGTIRLQRDELFLSAAVVSDVGNPIVVKQDTVEFNASSYRVGSSEVLRDLLKRMPGMEVSDDGSVKFNGEAIDKLTVSGRTFFLGDQSTALNNLPASIVDKVRVIDREGEASRSSGFKDGSREKVLDVRVKKEYEKGWFGNAGLKVGTSIGGGEDEELLRNERGLLYNANALVSAYGEKDQLTAIANAQNVNDSNNIVIVVSEDGNASDVNQGLSSAAQAGVNFNTSRIKDVESTVSVNYKYIDTDSGSKTQRTSFQDDGDLLSDTGSSGKSYVNSLSANMEFQKEKGKVWFHLRPELRFNDSNSYSGGTSQTLREGSLVNASSRSSHQQSREARSYLSGDISLRNLFGKAGRVLTFTGNASYSAGKGNSDEYSSLTIGSAFSETQLHYDSQSQSSILGGSLRYTEPLAEKWVISASAGYGLNLSSRTRGAFDQAGRNAYYSSANDNTYIRQDYEVTLQYKISERGRISLGGNLFGVLNETRSKTLGTELVAGEDEWLWALSPTLSFFSSGKGSRANFNVYAYRQRPSSSYTLPALSVSNLSRLSVGNIYLTPSTDAFFYGSWSWSNPTRFSSLMASAMGSLTADPVTFASWYDGGGVLYSVPVNAAAPSVISSLSLNWTTPLNANKTLSLSLGTGVRYNASTSYQSRTAMSGIDKDSFDYASFMSSFWGDEHGNRFYGGENGFEQGRTRSLSPRADISLRYNAQRWSLKLGASGNGMVYRYSLDPSAGGSTLDARLSAEGSYTSRHEFEFSSDFTYAFFSGYSAGYGAPEWRWNGAVSKNVGAFTFSLALHDILNQTRSLTHTVTANYVEDNYRLVMGRYILLGVKWNFGKMNAIHSARAQGAAFNMLFY